MVYPGKWCGSIAWVELILLGLLIEPGSAQEVRPATEPVILQSSELNESSGVAQVGELLWTHNDSGDLPRLFAFSSDGTLRGQFHVQGAKSIDWEDICAFSRDGKHYLAVGDVGDNSARRPNVFLYIIEVPLDLPAHSVDARDGAPGDPLSVAATLEVTYPTGPVNCEALAYDPCSGAFVLATKELFQCRLFRVAAPSLSGEQKVQAELIGQLRLPLVTAGDISPDGKQMVLLTYGPACLLHRTAPQATVSQATLSQATASEFRGDQGELDGWQTEGDHAVLIFELPNRRQGESICFSSDGKRLWLTSEFIPTPLLEVPLPGRHPQ